MTNKAPCDGNSFCIVGAIAIVAAVLGYLYFSGTFSGGISSAPQFTGTMTGPKKY
jgi:hypothetical protein